MDRPGHGKRLSPHDLCGPVRTGMPILRKFAAGSSENPVAERKSLARLHLPATAITICVVQPGGCLYHSLQRVERRSDDGTA